MPKIIKSTDRDTLLFSRFQREALEAIVMAAADDGEAGLSPVEILAEARQRAEQMIREGHAEGVRRGEETGKAQFLESVGESAAALDKAGEAMKQARQAFLESLEEEVVRLACAVAARILRREAAADIEVTRTAVRSALEDLVDRERLIVRLNPQDLETLRERGIGVLDEFGGAKDFEVVADESVDPGGCMVETDALHVDARLDTQIQQILDTMLE